MPVWKRFNKDRTYNPLPGEKCPEEDVKGHEKASKYKILCKPPS